MSHATQAPQRAAIVFAIPEAAHTELVQLCDHMHLMKQLTAVGTRASRHDARLRPDALAWWFTRLHKDLGAILDACSYSAELASKHEAAQQKRTG